MKKIYHPYILWEDWKAGLYNLSEEYSEKQQEVLARAAADFLSGNAFEVTALKVISEWKYSSEVNLSNKSRNRQAWIGQASCCYALGIPERITKYGWNLLSLEQQRKANEIADKVISVWERDHNA